MLFALDLPPGSEVLVPDYSTWFPVVPMRLFGLVPVWVDINPRTLNIDVEDCKRRLTKNTRAIMPVHWFGLPCDMDHICDFAKEHGIGGGRRRQPRARRIAQGPVDRHLGPHVGLQPASDQAAAGHRRRHRDVQEPRGLRAGHDLWRVLVPPTFPEDSPYRKYSGTALGGKLRMHPMSAILARIQLKHLAERNAAGVAQMKRLNDRLTQLPGLSPRTSGPSANGSTTAGT